MRLFSRGCESHQAAYLAAADRLGPDERIALELHAVMCADCADALRNGRRIDAALRGAFSPLRERRTIIAPGRVRLALGPRSARTNRWLRAPRFIGRLAEVSVMVGVTLFAVSTTLDPSTRQSTSTTATPAMVQELRGQTPLVDTDYLHRVRLMKPDVSSTASDQTRLPMGGRFDSDPVEIQKDLGSARR